MIAMIILVEIVQVEIYKLGRISRTEVHHSTMKKATDRVIRFIPGAIYLTQRYRILRRKEGKLRM